MTLDQFLIYVILMLVGLLIGGAGGQALIRRVVSPAGGQDDSDTKEAIKSATAATTAAANAAANTAAVNLALTQHITNIQLSLDKQGESLARISSEQTRMAQALEGYCEVCKTKHEAIDQREGRMQKEIDVLKR